jgi:hypothetical protein
MPIQRALKPWAFNAIGAIGGLILWFIPVALLPRHGAFGLDAPTELTLRVVGATVGIAWVVLFSALSYRSLDEFAREASKFAWYWGGAIGAGLSAPIYTFVALGGPKLLGLAPRVFADTSRAREFGFAEGYLLMAGCLTIGFVAARLWWTLSKR